MHLVVRHLKKTFGGFTAVDNVSFRLESGTLAALLGPSGSGKSTLLRMIAGTETPDQGEVHVSGNESIPVSATETSVGFVSHHYALAAHLSVAENIAAGLAAQNPPEKDVRDRVNELLDLLHLKGFENRYPAQLSGGQKQRAAVAKTLAPRPRILLLDESFGTLDDRGRNDRYEWIRVLHQAAGATTLFATHDQHEALNVADQILVMNRGQIEQQGAPIQIFDHPATPFVAEFVGESAFVEMEVSAPELVVWGGFKFHVDGYSVGQKVRIYFRPNDVYVSSAPETLQVKARILEAKFRGPTTKLVLDSGHGVYVTAHVPKGVAVASHFEEGRDVYVGITAFHIFPAPETSAKPFAKLVE